MFHRVDPRLRVLKIGTNERLRVTIEVSSRRPEVEGTENYMTANRKLVTMAVSSRRPEVEGTEKHALNDRDSTGSRFIA